MLKKKRSSQVGIGPCHASALLRPPVAEDPCCANSIEVDEFLSIRRGVKFYYMDEGILLRTKTLVILIRHYIRDMSGVFSVCHA